MLRCIQLAKNGLATTYPNPLVGSVVVHNNKIIGEGWHYKAGQPHAEVNAITSVANSALLSEATIYVNLEPCSHFGKTPPCADLIIDKGIKKVVIGTTDPNPKVAGKGIQKLMAAGCDVVVGVLEKQCEALNIRFFTFQQKKRPYIFLKWAKTTDGFIAPEVRDEQKPVWITSKLTRQQTHKLRAQEQAILVGTKTVLDDNPSLTTRDWYGATPMRLVLDRNLKVPADAAIFAGADTTYIFTEQAVEHTANCKIETINFRENIAQQICDVLYRDGIQSLIVEGGSRTLQTFIDAKLWDEAFVYTGSNNFKTGTVAPKLEGAIIAKNVINSDTLIHYKNTIA